MAPGKASPLQELLASVLPEHLPFDFNHISTPPTRCVPLFYQPQGAASQRTYSESHFLLASITTQDNKKEKLAVLAIEVIIYTTSKLTTAFVSKADSTGFLSLLNIPRTHASPLRSVATTFLSYLITQRVRPGIPLTISLFARAQAQYIFPNSVANTSKHVSTDRELVRWWCRVLDPILQSYTPEKPKSEGLFHEEKDAQLENEAATTAQAYLLVPGEETITTYVPVASRARWKHGHPLRSITPYPAAPPRCQVPHFPDDPKARFLDELDEELMNAGKSNQSAYDSPSKRGKGAWRSVKTLEHFWEAIAFRQECSSGNLVGFIWVVLTSPGANNGKSEGNTEDSQSTMADSQDSAFGISHKREGQLMLETDISPPLSPPHKTILTTPPEHSSNVKSSKHPKKQPRTPRKLIGPISVRQPKIKSATSTSPGSSLAEQTRHYLWPTSSRGEIVLDDKNYHRATDIILHLDFGGRDLAAMSTTKWTTEVGLLGGVGDHGKNWGWTVVGTKAAVVPVVSTVPAPSGTVTVLGVKRKGKAPIMPESSQEGVTNILGAGLVRKKPKLQENEPLSEQTPPRVHLLGPELARKKPKV
ncbi:DUF1714-domain-containing protein [Aulographum hederae CBS 113979]|uniref:histone acetyltransferase n=1 Tax=Aulographum hederae CBS 113979 TaxID=1176131 RepID=A0A6G1H644_9PEZI|nr:DUF1714-domain-containing protein [Aulographum hederae CBS 113979]